MSRTRDIETPEGKVRHEAKFHRILNAALEVFVEKGFHHAKISEVARAAGVADGTIYLYFKNKNDLMASLFDVKLEGMAQKLHDAIDQVESTRERLAQIIDFHLNLAQTQSNLLALMRHEVHVGYTPWGRRERAENNPYLAEWIRVMDDGIADKTFKTDLSSAALVQMLYGALDHACNVWVAQQQPESALREVRAYMRGMLLRT